MDLFCGAGGAAMGYARAGFTEIVGVDNRPQPHYPFTFVQGDAMTYPLGGFDAIHASPPCEHYSQLTPKASRARHHDLIAEVRCTLLRLRKPFIIENVPSAARLLHKPLMLCGSQFGLNLRRHRFFELHGFEVSELLQSCDHSRAPVLISGTHRRTYEPRYEYSVQACREAADIPWMTRVSIDKAIPPAYTEFIGRQLLQALREQPAEAV